MKKDVVIFLFFILTGISANAQIKSVKEVATSVAAFIKALEDGDIKTLSAIASDKLTYGHSSGKIQNKTEYLESFKTGASDFVKINITDQTIDVSGNTAVVRHLLDADTNDNNQPGHITLKIMTVWQKQGGKWILLARQAVKPAS
ncbi:MAG: nuclear transport factor 2 family protein [Niabella sp.]